MDIFNFKVRHGNPDTSQLLVLRGVPGSGKSTMAKTMSGRIHIEADMFFSLSGKYIWDPTKLGNAHKWCQEQVKNHLNDGEMVVVSNTGIKLWEIKPYLTMTNSVCVIDMLGRYQNVHGVSEAHIQKMLDRWEGL